MEITTHPLGERCTLVLNGRLDANWSDHVGQAIEAAIRSGQHHLELDFQEVRYVSSAGLRVLIKYFKQLRSARGSLRVVRPTDEATAILNLSGLASLLTAPATAAAASATPDDAPESWQDDGVHFQRHQLSVDARLTLQAVGQPDRFGSGTLDGEAATILRCEPDVIALGLGGFGSSAEDVRPRLGESLTVAGAAVALPTDGSSVPDYQVTEADLVPTLSLAYGLIGRGRFRHLLRFEASAAPRGVLALSSLIETAFRTSGAEAVGFALLAETAGVVGATLRRSPADAGGKSPWDFPSIRDWLSFTTERTDERSLVLATGFAVRHPDPDRAAFFRPLGADGSPQAHCHAAVFPYRPLPKGRLDLPEAVAALMATDSAQTVLHLLTDDRPFEGLGETDLMRGACWVAPLDTHSPAP